LAQARVEARSRDALLVIHFRLDERPLSRQMDATVLHHPELQRTVAEGFVHVRADAEREHDDFARLVGGGPGVATCVLEPDSGGGEVVAMRAGFATADELVALLLRAKADRDHLRRLRQWNRLAPAAGSLLLQGEILQRNGAVRQAQACYLLGLDVAAGDGAAAGLCAGLAELAIESGDVVAARSWAAGAAARCQEPPALEPASRLVTIEARILFAERRLAEAAAKTEVLLAEHPADPRRTSWLALRRAVQRELQLDDRHASHSH